MIGALRFAGFARLHFLEVVAGFPPRLSPVYVPQEIIQLRFDTTRLFDVEFHQEILRIGFDSQAEVVCRPPAVAGSGCPADVHLTIFAQRLGAGRKL